MSKSKGRAVALPLPFEAHTDHLTEKMAKQLKTANELEQLIVAAASKVQECEALTGVTIQRLDDDHVRWANTDHGTI